MEELHERYAEIPLGRQLVVTDEGGDRSFLAASYLIRKGIDAVRLAGGMKQWRALPSEGPKAPANR